MSTTSTSKPKYKTLQEMNLPELELQQMNLRQLENFALYFGINIDEINRNSFHIDKYISSPEFIKQLNILNEIKTPELKKLATKFNIKLSNSKKFETLRKNFIKKIYDAVIKKREEYGAKVLYENLPHDIREEIEKKAQLSANPEIEQKIEEILRGTNIYRLMNYDYYKIRSSLEIKHYNTEKEIEIKLREFQIKYIIYGVVQYYYKIDEILGIISQDIDFQLRNEMFINLKEYIEKYNLIAKELKTNFFSSIKPEFIDEINDTIKKFNKKFKKHLPYLKYGTREFLSLRSNSSRKNRYSSRRLTRRANTM